jgi:hypothetical protein
MSDPAHVLADHLEAMREGRGMGRASDYIAEAIIADPQWHIDALVAAGVLRPARTVSVGGSGSISVTWPNAYEVAPPKPPHVHSWRVVAMGREFQMTVELICNTGDCGERRRVPNRLPIEVPA